MEVTPFSTFPFRKGEGIDKDEEYADDDSTDSEKGGTSSGSETGKIKEIPKEAVTAVIQTTPEDKIGVSDKVEENGHSNANVPSPAERPWSEQQGKKEATKKKKKNSRNVQEAKKRKKQIVRKSAKNFQEEQQQPPKKEEKELIDEESDILLRGRDFNVSARARKQLEEKYKRLAKEEFNRLNRKLAVENLLKYCD